MQLQAKEFTKRFKWAIFSAAFIVSQFGPLTLLPATVNATPVGDVNGCSIEKSATTWTLKASCTSTAQIDIPAGITLDGAGYTISPSFAKTDNSNNSVIGVLASDVTINNLVINGTGGSNLHGINIYLATNINVTNVTVKNANKSGILVNGSIVNISNVTTSGNGWHGINVDQGSGVAQPAILNIVGAMYQTDNAQIYVDDITKNVQVNDTLMQYSYIEPAGGLPNDRLYSIKPTKPIISVPAKNAVLTTAQLTIIDWSDSIASIPGGVTYEYRSYSDAAYTADEFINPSIPTSEADSSGSPERIYYIQVRAKDAYGNFSLWSNDASDPYKITLDNTAPSTPTNLLPTDNYVFTTFGDPVNYAFSWSTVTDPNGPVKYDWESSYDPGVVSPGGAFNNQLGHRDNYSDIMVNSSDVPGVYYWHVRAIDAAGNKSVWSDPWKVTIKQVYQPILTLKKTAINDNGGTVLSNKFELFANNTKFVDGVALTNGDATTTTYIVPNATEQEYTLSETPVDGYGSSDWYCKGNSTPMNGKIVTPKVDENVTCEITNNDIPPALTLIKKLSGKFNGNATINDWYLEAINGPSVLGGKGGAQSDDKLKAGDYTLSESSAKFDKPQYTSSGWQCSMTDTKLSTTTTLKLGIGQSYTCTITNELKPAKITVYKKVINKDGGTKIASDFKVKVGGQTKSFEQYNDNPLKGVAVFELDPSDGPFSVKEKGNNKDTYKVSYSDDIECNAQTVSPVLATSFVDNNEEGQKYDECGTGCDDECGSECGDDVCGEPCQNITLVNGQEFVCNITNNDKAPKLTLQKQVVNNNGGKSVSSDWNLIATPDAENDFNAKTISGNGADGVVNVRAKANVVYTLSESGPSGYTAGKWSCEGGSLKGNLLTMSLGEKATCKITNDDIAVPSISVVLTPICKANFPYMRYTVTLTNFKATKATFNWYSVTPGDDLSAVQATQVVNSAIDTSLFTGEMLWPGADTTKPDWPGWNLVNGQWVETRDDVGGKLRPNARVEVSVNPVIAEPTYYPGATTGECNPPQELVNTGAGNSTLLGMLVAGAMLGGAFVAIRRPRATAQV